MSTTTTSEECIDLCNKMLRGERSAVETYNMVIEKFSGDQDLSELHRIRDEHRESVSALEANVREMGGQPSDDSGAWGAFAKTVAGTANLIGEESALEALQKGEEKGCHDYREALKSDTLTPSCRELYAETLLPRTEQHIATLEKLQEVVS